MVERDNRSAFIQDCIGALPMTVDFRPPLPILLLVLLLVGVVLPRAAGAESFLFGGGDNIDQPPAVEKAREGPFEVICVDQRDNEVITFGPLFRVLRDNGMETRWQYEMQDGLTFIGRFDDWLTCQWKDRRTRR